MAAQCKLKTQRIPTHRISIAGVLRAYRKPIREYKSRPDWGDDLSTLVFTAIIDNYPRRSKANRDYPRRKQEQPAGPPKITNVTLKQKQQARQIKNALQKKG